MVGLKTLHVVCAVLWLGNFVVTGVWSARAFATRQTELRAFAAREILFTDAIFTLVFGTAVTVSGILLAGWEGVAMWETRWTRVALETVAGAGLVWLFVLLPLEVRLWRLSRQASSSAALRTAFVTWNVVGWLVTIALFGVIYLMLGKPA